MTGTPVLVSVRGAAARYGRREVFRDLSFDLRHGQALGVLGPNGAGKTTLLRMLIGCLSPVAGDVRIAGFRPRDALGRTSVAYFAGAATLSVADPADPFAGPDSGVGSTPAGQTILPQLRPTLEELRHDLRAIMQACRADYSYDGPPLASIMKGK